MTIMSLMFNANEFSVGSTGQNIAFYLMVALLFIVIIFQLHIDKETGLRKLILDRIKRNKTRGSSPEDDDPSKKGKP